MEEKNSTGTPFPNDPEINDSDSLGVEPIEDPTQELERERLTEAMYDWKKKGNSRLANACADALGLGNSENPDSVPEDEFSANLKIEVERLEAEAEFQEKKKNKNDLEVNEPLLPEQEKAPGEEGSERVLEQKETDFEQLEKGIEEKEIEIRDQSASTGEIKSPPEESIFLEAPSSVGAEQDITNTSLIFDDSLRKRFTNTKFVLQLIGVFLLFEFLRAVLTLFFAF